LIDQSIKDKYKLSIGIECHVQLKTKSKLFSSVGNDAREASPNTLVSHIDFGLPGALPVLNKQAIYLACKAAYALNSSPSEFSKFDRKHYFYPDLPMGYQITQYDQPIVEGGSVDILVEGQPKTIGVTRAHLEADAGKSVHPTGTDYSLVDLNRAGTPLLEIVSEPDMTSAAEAKAYARELYLLMRYAGVSEADLYYGNMRFDVNVSVSKTDELGLRTETKNLNSFRSVEKAVEYEFIRQIEELEKGNRIIQETRGWNDDKQRTFSQRSKENADDYRYMPDPDLPPVVLDKAYADSVKNDMPILPAEWRGRLKNLGIDAVAIETLLEAQVDLDSDFLGLIELASTDVLKSKAFVNWLINIEVPFRKDLILNGKDITVKDTDRRKMLDSVYELVSSSKLNSTKATELIKQLLVNPAGTENIEEFAEANGFIQVSDQAEIDAIAAQVIKDNPKAADDVRNGELKAIGFLVGQVMKHSYGKANPQLAQAALKKQLGN